KKDAAEPRFLMTQLKSYGELGHFLSAGRTETAPFPGPVTGLTPFRMNGREVYKFATHKVPELIESCCAASGLELGEIDHFLLHQANYRIIKQVAKRLGLPEEKFPCNIAEYGNTSAASEAILLAEQVEQGKVKPGDLLVLAGFGGGLTAAAMIVRL
ncbi:3-oxoacyl-[acyl-carrier-protein] synthase III C-terminal domain-containing protein, partial [Lactobacillus nasalidis]